MWDEKNIEECEAGKDATMKVDEPDTPFNFGYDATAAMAEAEEDGSHSCPRNGIDAKELESALDAMMTADQERQKHQKEFEEHRKAHYDEYLALKKMREERAAKLNEELEEEMAEQNDKTD